MPFQIAYKYVRGVLRLSCFVCGEGSLRAVRRRRGGLVSGAGSAWVTGGSVHNGGGTYFLFGSINVTNGARAVVSFRAEQVRKIGERESDVTCLGDTRRMKLQNVQRCVWEVGVHALSPNRQVGEAVVGRGGGAWALTRCSGARGDFEGGGATSGSWHGRISSRKERGRNGMQLELRRAPH